MSNDRETDADRVAQEIRSLVERAGRAQTIVHPRRSATIIRKLFPASGMNEAEIAERITMAAIYALVRVEIAPPQTH